MIHLNNQSDSVISDIRGDGMSEHSRKKIAPIVITVIMVIFYVFYFSVLINAVPGLLMKILIGIIPLALGGTTIAMCIQRIKEIDGGEEDDIGKY